MTKHRLTELGRSEAQPWSAVELAAARVHNAAVAAGMPARWLKFLDHHCQDIVAAADAERADFAAKLEKIALHITRLATDAERNRKLYLAVEAAGQEGAGNGTTH